MNTHMTRFRDFHYFLYFCALDENDLSIRRVRGLTAKQYSLMCRMTDCQVTSSTAKNIKLQGYIWVFSPTSAPDVVKFEYCWLFVITSFNATLNRGQQIKI